MMRNHVISIGIGASMAVVGLALWLTTGDVETPIVSLSTVGVVLMVLGLLELAISGAALASPSTRHREEPL